MNLNDSRISRQNWIRENEDEMEYKREESALQSAVGYEEWNTFLKSARIRAEVESPIK